MRILKDVIKKNIAAIILWIFFSAFNMAVYLLYDISAEPVVYLVLLTLFFLMLFLALEILKEKKRSDQMMEAMLSMPSEWRNLPKTHSGREEDYQQMISLLGGRIEELMAEYSDERKETGDYYTNWVHQIKTPIAVMKLKLSADTPENRALAAELFRIEQYVDMVLQYIRLGTATRDLVIMEYSLDELIKESVRKYASQFIEKKLGLEYSSISAKLVTDRKWFTCILDQLISNAIKYTASGRISIYLEGEKLVIEDTGTGIAAEDIPRIFEKGFTGNNGRLGENSSGLGLYLVMKASDILSLPVSVKSEPGKGSSFIIDLEGKVTPTLQSGVHAL